MAPHGFEVNYRTEVARAKAGSTCFEPRRNSIGPGEGDLVERLGPEFLRRARDHAAAERAVKLRRGIVVGERPDHHALQAALQQIASRGGKQPAAEAETLKFRPQVKLVDFA